MDQTIGSADAADGHGASTKRQRAPLRRAAPPSRPKPKVPVKTDKPQPPAAEGAKDSGADRSASAARVPKKRRPQPGPGAVEQRQDLSALKALLVEPRRKMEQQQTLAARTQKSLGEALAATLELCRKLTTNLPVLWDLCASENVWLTAATKKRPCLAVLKLVAPALEVKTASRYGKALTHALDSGLDPAGFRQAVIDQGVVELARHAERRPRSAAALAAPAQARREQSAALEASHRPSQTVGEAERDPAPRRKRQEPDTKPAVPPQSGDRNPASPMPGPAAKSQAVAETPKADLAARLRKQQKPVLLHGIDAHACEGMVLVIAEAVGGNLYAYDLDVDPARVDASMQAALRRAPLLRRLDAAADDPEASALGIDTPGGDHASSATASFHSSAPRIGREALLETI